MRANALQRVTGVTPVQRKSDGRDFFVLLSRIVCVKLGILDPAMNYRIDDRDLSAFLVYAARERSLDASLRAANKYGRSEEHKKSIDALRELNKKMLFRETRRDIHPF